MKKDKIEIGQCYEKNDIIYMIKSLAIQAHTCRAWLVEDTLRKQDLILDEEYIRNMHRPFQNFG